MSDSDSMSYDFSSQWTVDTILPPQQEDPENNTTYRRRWLKMAVILLAVAVVYNAVVGVGLHAGISYIERQILLREQQRAFLAQTTAIAANKITTEENIPTTVSSEIWRPEMNTFKLQTGNSDNLKESNRGPIVIGWDGPDVTDGVTLVDKRKFTIMKYQPIMQIYSHLTFHAGSDKGMSDFNQTIWRKTSKGAEDVLIVDSQIKNCTFVKKQGDPCFTSIIFSALRLHKGDNIYVTTSHNTNIIRNASCTFFGIYQL